MSEKYLDKRLMKLSKSNGKFLKLEEGDTFVGTYLTWRAEMDEKFGKMKPVYVFKNENGEEKQLGTSAKKFGGKMACIVPGSVVQIVRLGEGQKTDYSVKVLKSASMPSNIAEDEEDEAPVKKKKRVIEEDEEEDEPVKKKKKHIDEDEDEEDEDEDEEDEEEDESLFSK